jgi:hypothetical protein
MLRETDDFGTPSAIRDNGLFGWGARIELVTFTQHGSIRGFSGSTTIS